MLLGAAAPLLVVGGLLAGTTVGDGDQPTAAVSARDDRVASVPVPPAATSPTGTPAAARTPPVPGVRPDTVVVPSLDVRADVDPDRDAGRGAHPARRPAHVGWWSERSAPGRRRPAPPCSPGTPSTRAVAPSTTSRTLVDRRRGSSCGPTAVALTYVVDSVEVLGRAELARDSAAIFEQGGPARLVLITCEDWDGTAYLSNVVVIATPRS